MFVLFLRKAQIFIYNKFKKIIKWYVGIYRVVVFDTPSYLSHLMRNLNLEFLIFSFVSGLTGGTLIWLIVGTLRMVLRHFLRLYPRGLRMPPLWHWHCAPHSRGQTGVVTERINDLPGLTFLLFWFFQFITYHLNWKWESQNQSNFLNKWFRSIGFRT